MALYLYEAFSRVGSKMNGTIDAASEGSVRELLMKQGLYPVNIMPANQARQSSFFADLFSRSVEFKDILLFTKQLAVLLRSSVPLLQAIELLVDQFEGKFHRVLVSIKDGLREGASFADGLKQHSDVFENIYIQLVRAGEVSGKLDFILDRLVLYLDRKDQMQKRISAALFDPMLKMGIIGVVSVFLLTSVVPQLASVFESQGSQLPAITQIVMSISSALMNNYIMLSIGLSIIIITFLYWKSTPKGAKTIDNIKLHIPVVKTFSRFSAIIQFCNTLGILLESGVIFSEALDIVVSIVDNRILRDALESAKEKIVKQGRITQYLKETGIFPSIALYLIGVGEESGKLDFMLRMVGTNYESDLAEMADKLPKVLDTVLMVVMSLVVGAIVAAVVIPMANLGSLV